MGKPLCGGGIGLHAAYRNSATGAKKFKPTAGALREDIAVAVVKLRGYDTRLADLSLPGSPSNLLVTKDGRYLFYDDAGKVIRMIAANPEY